MLVVGESGSGKSQWVVQHLVLDEQSPYDQVIWVAPAASLEQPLVQKLIELHETEDGSPSAFIPIAGLGPEQLAEVDELTAAGAEQGLQMLVVVDDIVAVDGNRKKIELWLDRLWTPGRHLGVSCVLLTQRIFLPSSRTLRINSNGFVCFTFGDRRESKALFQQLSPSNWKDIDAAHKHAVSGRGAGAALFIDRQAEHSADPSHRVLRFRQCGTHKDGSSMGLSTCYTSLADIE